MCTDMDGTGRVAWTLPQNSTISCFQTDLSKIQLLGKPQPRVEGLSALLVPLFNQRW